MDIRRRRTVQALASALTKVARQRGPASYEIPLASHLVTPRKFKALTFTHHCIYIGGGRVIHYSGFSQTMASGPVAETALYDFAMGNPVQVLHYPKGSVRFTPEEIIRRARSRMGEDQYDLLRNNCEHFAEWCCTGVNAAYQNKRLWGRILLVSELLVTRAGSLALRKYGRKLIRRYLPGKYVSFGLLTLDVVSLGLIARRLRKHIREDRARQFRLGPPSSRP